MQNNKIRLAAAMERVDEWLENAANVKSSSPVLGLKLPAPEAYTFTRIEAEPDSKKVKLTIQFPGPAFEAEAEFTVEGELVANVCPMANPFK